MQDSIKASFTWFNALLPWNRQPELNKTNTINALDGVRALATLAVVSFHVNSLTHDALFNITTYPLAGAFSTFGGSGVTLFFVLSGFLLFTPYAKALLFQEKWPSIGRFYKRRALRIIPGYYVALALIIIFFQHQYLHSDYRKQLLLFVTFFMDSSRSTFRQLNGPFWTLAIEWQFYMLLPLIALAFYFVAKRISPSPRLRLLVMLGCCGILIAWGLFLRYVGGYYSAPDHLTQTFLVPRSALNVLLFFSYGIGGKYLENFAVGMIISLCYIFAQHPATGTLFLTWGKRLSLWVGAIGLVVFSFTAAWHFNVLQAQTPMFAFLNPLTENFDWLNEIFIAIAYGSGIFAVLFGPLWFKRIFEWKPLRWIGLISYGMYMWHLPLLIFFETRVLPHLPAISMRANWFALWGWVAIFVVPVAFASYTLIEKPWIQLGEKKETNTTKLYTNSATPLKSSW